MLLSYPSPALVKEMVAGKDGAQPRAAELATLRQAMVAEDLAKAKLLRAVYGNRQLEEVLADFWYNHFNVFLEKGADRYLVTAYERDEIRPYMLGKFEDLLRATCNESEQRKRTRQKADGLPYD